MTTFPTLRRGALLVAACFLIGAHGASATPDAGGPQEAPDFGVIQFTDDEAFIDVPVTLATAWARTLEVVASLSPAVPADLPYMENNGRIITSDLWIAVETEGDALRSWVRIRVGLPTALGQSARTRAEILLDAIADRLELDAPKPAAEPAAVAPPLPASVEGLTEPYVVNNYYYDYGSAPYSTYYEPMPSWAYAPAAWSPWWYGSVCSAYISPSYYDHCGWNSGWWYGWGGPWCNPWGSSFSLCLSSGWNWSLSACFGTVCAGWGWGCAGWGCDPWYGWGGCAWWSDGDCNDDSFCDSNSANGTGVSVLGPRLANLPGSGSQPGPLASPGTAGPRIRLANADVQQTTNRPTRRATEPSRPVVTHTSRTPRTTRTVVVTGSDRPVATSTPSTTTRTSSTPSRSSKRDGPTVVKLGSVPYSNRIPGTVASRGETTTLAGGDRPYTTIPSHPYSNPYGDGRSSAPSQPSMPAPAPSAPVSVPRAPAPSVSAPPSMPTSAPRSSPSPAPRASSPSPAPRASAPAPAPRASSPSPSSIGSRSSGSPSGGSSRGGGGRPR